MRRGIAWIAGFAAGVLLVSLPVLCRAQANQEQLENAADAIEEAISGKGEINWTQGYIEAIGEGLPSRTYQQTDAGRMTSARTAAIKDAQRNLLEIVKGINIDARTQVRNQEVLSDEINARVEGLVRNARIVEKLTKVETFTDGSMKVTVTMRMPLYGSGKLADIVEPVGGGLPSNVRPYWGKPTNPLDPSKLPDSIKKPVDEQKKPLAEIYSGLIIDGRGLGIHPALAPKILAENGNEVYGTAFVSREYAINQGIVGYAKSETFARRMDRVADNPLMVKAVKASGDLKTDVVVTLEDAYKIEKLKASQLFLHQCRVVFLVD